MQARGWLFGMRALAAEPSEPQDAALLGIGLVVAAVLSFSISDALAKSMTAQLPPVEIAWLRWCGFVVLVLPALATSRGRVLRSRAPGLQVLRSLGLVGSSVFIIVAFAYLPMATATATSFVSPLFVTALSIPFLGERVGVRRWAAVLVGLVGVLIIVRPGGAGVSSASLLPLLSAASWAVALICTRRTRGSDGAMTAMAYSALVGFAVLSALVALDWVTPRPDQVALAAAMALFSTTGQFLVVLAYYRAPASILAPFSYTQLIWSGALGYLVFDNLPDAWTWIGAVIIVGSGIYTAHRERRRMADAREGGARRPIPAPTVARS